MNKHKFGHFSQDGTEYIITDPHTPRAFDNFLWNDSLFSVVHQTGVGFFDYQIGDTEAVKLLTGIGRICDFDVFGRDGLMSRLVYIRDNHSGEFWNLNWEPVKKPFEDYRCIHGLGYTKIESTVNALFSGFRIFVPKGKDPVELWTLDFENQSLQSRDLSIFVYNQFSFKYKWGFNSYGDMLFRKSYFQEKLNAMIANKHPHITPHYYQTGFMTADMAATGYDGSRDFFMGIYNGYNEPEAVIEGKCRNIEGSSDSTIGVMQFDFVLEPGASRSMNMMLGVTQDEAGIAELKDKYLLNIEDYYQELKDENTKFIEKNRVKTPDEHFNRMLNIWIKHQTAYGAQWCRWGWMGYRDIVQHGYGVSTFNPSRTREILVEAFRYQYQNGMAVRGWNPVDTKAYSDSALWLVYTLISYLKETGDMEFLDQEIQFFDDGSATVLEHVERALGFLEINKGSHGLCLIKFGDWNDSLTAIGKEGRGESVWLSMAYAEAVMQMAGLYKHLNEVVKHSGFMEKYNNISEAINKTAWDGRWYTRCFDDNGRPIGSDKNEQGKIFINTQGWALIAGLANKERTKALLKASDEILRTDLGYMLLAPTFTEPDDHVGRISCLEPGICENGTVYSHVNAWMILGLLRVNKPDEAYETFKRITPGYMNGPNDLKQNSPPYIYANGYFGPAHRNNKFQMEYTWITGSVAWHYNTLTKEMIGIFPDYDGLTINPKLPSEWNQIEVSREFRGKNFDITIVRGEKFIIKLNHVFIGGNKVLLSECDPENILEVITT